MITWDDFQKVDIRVGKILEVSDFPQARQPAYQLRIDFGEELGEKKSSAQLTNYAKEDLLGRQVVAVVNFPPKQIANFMSEVLVLGVPAEDRGIALLGPDCGVQLGVRVY